MKKKLFFLLFGLLFSLHLFSQEIELSPFAKISIITVDPGDQLVDAFGHSAIRVKDSSLGIDIAYNYGTYNFNTPNFYGKFAQGKLLYDLGRDHFNRFLKNYVLQNRTVTEQILNLEQSEKQQFFEFLQYNAKPENKSYLYDFLFDNCATKLPEVSSKILKDKIEFNYGFKQKDLTFRDLIHQYLGEQPWGAFGIDLALGSVIDRKATPKEYTFLPDYVLKSYESSTIKKGSQTEPLLIKTNVLYKSELTEKKQSYFTPFIIFSIIALLVFWITFKDHKTKRRSKWLDITLFLFTGIIGLVVLLLWLATDHSATANNFNILWAFMPNLIMGFQLLKNDLKSWVKKYIAFLIILLFITILLWVLKIQIFSIALAPILLLLMVRYLHLIRS